MKIQKKKLWGVGRGHGRCEQRSEAFVKIRFFFFFVFFFFGGGGGSGVGGQDGCERRIKVFWKIPKKKIFLGGEGVGSGGGVGLGRSG